MEDVNVEVPGLEGKETQTAADEETKKQIEQAQARLREVLAEKGVGQEHLDAWKSQHQRIAAFPIYDDVYVIRPINRMEWRRLMTPVEGKETNDADIEEKITMLVTLYPRLDPSELRTSGFAGVPATIARAAEMISGFQPGSLPIIL